MREQIDDALSTLRERDALVLRLYYGLGDGREHTLEEIGQSWESPGSVCGSSRPGLKELREGDKGRSGKLRRCLTQHRDERERGASGAPLFLGHSRATSALAGV